MTTSPMPQKLMQESLVKGDEGPSAAGGRASLLPCPPGSEESPYKVSLLLDKLGKPGLGTWEKWTNPTGVQTSLLAFNLLCALAESPTVLIACKQSKLQLERQREGMAEEGLAWWMLVDTAERESCLTCHREVSFLAFDCVFGSCA